MTNKISPGPSLLKRGKKRRSLLQRGEKGDLCQRGGEKRQE